MPGQRVQHFGIIYCEKKPLEAAGPRNPMFFMLIASTLIAFSLIASTLLVFTLITFTLIASTLIAFTLLGQNRGQNHGSKWDFESIPRQAIARPS